MPLPEIDAMKTIDDTLSQVDNADMRDRILRWAWAKYCSSPIPNSIPLPALQTQTTKKAQSSKKTPKTKTTKTKTSLSILKDLNLKPNGKKSFSEFTSETKPVSNHDKSIVAVYYMQHTLGITEITASHVYTCFKMAGWRMPYDLENELQWVASQKGWLNTSSMSKIHTTTHGDNYIEHDLPKKSSKKE